jgi:hypothetical protein
VLNLKRNCHENSLRFGLKRDMDQPSFEKKGLKVRSRKFRKWAVANAVEAPNSAKQWACAQVAFGVSSWTEACLPGAGPWCSIRGSLMRHAMNLKNGLLVRVLRRAHRSGLETPMTLHLNTPCDGYLLMRHWQATSTLSWR